MSDPVPDRIQRFPFNNCEIGSMKIGFSINPGATIPIPCPKCGHKQNELVSRLRNNPEIVCPSCGSKIAVKGDQLDALVKALERFAR